MTEKDIEKLILTSMARNNDNIKKIQNILDPKDFMLSRYKIVFKAIIDLYKKNDFVDLISLASHLKDHPEIEETGGTVFIDEIYDNDSYITDTNILFYVKKLKENANKHKTRLSLERISRDTSKTNDELIEYLEGILETAKGERIDTDIEPAFNNIEPFFDKEDEGLKTGYEGIDKQTGLNGLSGFTIIGGAPKSWKSTLIFNIAYNISKSGVPVLYIDFENGLKRLMKRKLSEYLEIDYFKTSKNYISSEKAGDYQNFLDEMKSNTLFYNKEFSNLVVSKDKLNLNGVKRFLNTIRKTNNTEKALLVIDSFQKLPLASLSDRRAGIDLWLRELETLKKQESIDILAVSELSRQGQEKVTSQSFKESGDIEYTAENLLALYRLPEDKLNLNIDQKAVLSLECLMTRDSNPVSNYLSFFEVGKYFNLQEISYHTDKTKYEMYKNILNNKDQGKKSQRENNNNHDDVNHEKSKDRWI